MIAGGFSWDIKFKTAAWAAWDRLMLGRDTPKYQIRLRADIGNVSTTTEWRTIITDKSRAAFTQSASMRGQISGADARLKLAQTARTRAWRELRISDVVTRIAADYGLDVDAERSASVDTYDQVRMNDWAFLRWLCAWATTESGRCDTYLWMDENTLHFGAPQLTDTSVRRYDMSVVENRVNDYAVAYYGREADRQGAAQLRGVGFDWRTKRGVVFTMGDAQAQTQPSLAPRVPRRMSDGLRVFPVFDEAPGTIEELVRGRWGHVSPRYFSMRINTRCDLTLRPNSVISMESNLGEGQSTPFMGRYVVLEVQHTFNDGYLITSLVGYRREAQGGDAQPTGANADTAGSRDNYSAGGENTARKTILVAQELPNG
jgi:hypothetical protein